MPAVAVVHATDVVKAEGRAAAETSSYSLISSTLATLETVVAGLAAAWLPDTSTLTGGDVAAGEPAADVPAAPVVGSAVVSVAVLVNVSVNAVVAVSAVVLVSVAVVVTTLAVVAALDWLPRRGLYWLPWWG